MAIQNYRYYNLVVCNYAGLLRGLKMDGWMDGNLTGLEAKPISEFPMSKNTVPEVMRNYPLKISLLICHNFA